MTPTGDAAAASAAATAAAQEAEQEQLRRAAVQGDDLLAFDFAGTVSAVLQDHQQAAQASAEQAAPITDAVQEQLLVLDKVSLGTVHRGDAWASCQGQVGRAAAAGQDGVPQWLPKHGACLPIPVPLALIWLPTPPLHAAEHAGGGAAPANWRAACGPHHLLLLPGLHGRPACGALDVWACGAWL